MLVENLKHKCTVHTRENCTTDKHTTAEPGASSLRVEVPLYTH